MLLPQQRIQQSLRDSSSERLNISMKLHADMPRNRWARAAQVAARVGHALLSTPQSFCDCTHGRRTTSARIWNTNRRWLCLCAYLHGGNRLYLTGTPKHCAVHPIPTSSLPARGITALATLPPISCAKKPYYPSRQTPQRDRRAFARNTSRDHPKSQRRTGASPPQRGQHPLQRPDPRPPSSTKNAGS